MVATPTSATADSQNKARPNSPAYWVFLPGLLVSGWALSATLPRTSFFHAQMGLALLVFVPSFVGPIFLALGQRVAASICAAVVVGSYWTLSLFLFFLYTRESVIGLLYIAQIFLPALAIALATIDSVNRRLGPTWAVGTAGVGSFSGILGAIFLLAAKSAELSYVRPLDPIALAPEMITISKCSQEFARSHPESGFPESLRQLGPQGSSCIPEALLANRAKGFTISYEPGPKDARGKISSYKVTGRESSPQGKDLSSIFTDESGLIHIRFDGPHGKGATIDLSSDSMSLQNVVNCVGDNSGRSEFRYPNSNITHSDRDQAIRDCVLLNPYLKRSLTGNRKFSIGGYDFEYSLVPGENGTISGFSVQGRPRPYGVAGVRSYLAVGAIDVSSNTICVYATPEDRPATIKDPLAKASEVGLSCIGTVATFGKAAIH